MRFKIDWASIVVCSKFTVFALFYFVFEGNFPSTSPRGGLYLERLIHGGFFFFSEFYGMSAKRELNLSMKQKIFSTFPIMRNLDGFCLPVCLFLIAIYTL